MQDFVNAVGGVYAAAAEAPGYVAHASRTFPNLSKFDQQFGEFGELVLPRFYTGGKEAGTVTSAETLSLWTSIEMAKRFVYDGLHKEVLARRAEWMVKPQWPGYVLWWANRGSVPTWREGCLRLERLHDQGPSIEGFTFRTSFQPQASV